MSTPLTFYQNIRPGIRPIFVIGGVHGDEPEGVELALQIWNWLKSEAIAGRELPTSWVVIPALNLDGWVLKQRTNANGVDLNRNYPSLCWNPEARAARYNPGVRPGSEPQIQSLIQMIEKFDPHLIIHCHSWVPCVVYAGEGAKLDAERLGKASGYAVQNDIGYPTPGSLSGYGWLDHGIPVICIEEQEGMPLSQVWPHFAEGVKQIFYDAKYRDEKL